MFKNEPPKSERPERDEPRTRLVLELTHEWNYLLEELAEKLNTSKAGVFREALMTLEEKVNKDSGIKEG